jgi:hypothetical protein
MKKFILTGLVVASLFTTTLISCSTDEKDVQTSQSITQKSGDFSIDEMSPEAPPEGSVKTVWTLGRKSKGCHGIGLCKHEKTTITIGKLPPYTFPDPPYPTSNRVYSDVLKIDDDTIWIEMDDYSAQNVRDYFGGDYVILEEALVLDNSELDISINPTFVIDAGTYTLQKRTATGLWGIVVTNAK